MVTLLDTDSSARNAMIDCQLRTSGVTAPFVVKRMGEVPREDFVPEAAKGIAYMDRAIALGEGKALAAPLVHGMLLQEARPKSDEHVIVIDAGSGYLAELVRPLVGSIKVLSPAEAIAPTRGGKKADLIIVDGAIEHVPANLAKRLGENGRIVTGLVQERITSVAIGRLSGKEVALRTTLEIGIPVLTEFDKPKGWSF